MCSVRVRVGGERSGEVMGRGSPPPPTTSCTTSFLNSYRLTQLADSAAAPLQHPTVNYHCNIPPPQIGRKSLRR